MAQRPITREEVNIACNYIRLGGSLRMASALLGRRPNYVAESRRKGRKELEAVLDDPAKWSGGKPVEELPPLAYLALQVGIAEAEIEQRCIESIQRGMDGFAYEEEAASSEGPVLLKKWRPGDWRAAAEYLRKRFPKDWRDQQQVDVKDLSYEKVLVLESEGDVAAVDAVPKESGT